MVMVMTMATGAAKERGGGERRGGQKGEDKLGSHLQSWVKFLYAFLLVRSALNLGMQ